MPELWRTISVHEGYEVSSLGRVRNRKTGRVLKPWLVGPGYEVVALGGKTRIYIHQAVCTAWCGERPDGMHACHRNDIKTDNREENLYWGTPSQNREDSRANGTLALGKKHGRSKLSESQVLEMRRVKESTGMSYKKLGEAYGVSRVTAFHAVKGRYWKHLA